jgi:hypothetical protein
MTSDGVVRKRLTHHAREDSHDMTRVPPVEIRLLLEPQIGLVHQGGRLQRVREAFAPQVGSRERTQLIIDLGTMSPSAPCSRGGAEFTSREGRGQLPNGWANVSPVVPIALQCTASLAQPPAAPEDTHRLEQTISDFRCVEERCAQPITLGRRRRSNLAAAASRKKSPFS